MHVVNYCLSSGFDNTDRTPQQEGKAKQHTFTAGGHFGKHNAWVINQRKQSIVSCDLADRSIIPVREKQKESQFSKQILERDRE